MDESNHTQLTSISKALDEIADFWDTHSLGDYWEQTHEVEFEVRAKRTPRVTRIKRSARLALPRLELINR